MCQKFKARSGLFKWPVIFAGILLAGGSFAETTVTKDSTPSVSTRDLPYEQGWLGADGAYSISLGNNRSLWIFADTFVGPRSATGRTQSPGFIHNSVGFSTCAGIDCSFQYYWNGMGTSSPGPVFSAPGNDWFWPMDGFIYNGTLYIALMQMHADGGGAFGFAYSGSQLASISNYTDPPAQWKINYQQLNTGGSAVPGVSIVVNQGPGGNPDPSNPQGANYAYFLTVMSGKPSLALLRIPLDQLNILARPANGKWQYLNTHGAWTNWAGNATTLPADAAAVINPGATEMTVRYHSSTKQWIAVFPMGLQKAGFYSLSPSLTGGWGAPKSLYAYPELQASNSNYTSNLFCYADKEHPELETAGQLVFTYACNSTVENEIIRNMNLYHPVVVSRPLPSR